MVTLAAPVTCRPPPLPGLAAAIAPAVETSLLSRLDAGNGDGAGNHFDAAAGPHRFVVVHDGKRNADRAADRQNAAAAAVGSAAWPDCLLMKIARGWRGGRSVDGHRVQPSLNTPPPPCVSTPPAPIAALPRATLLVMFRFVVAVSNRFSVPVGRIPQAAAFGCGDVAVDQTAVQRDGGRAGDVQATAVARTRPVSRCRSIAGVVVGELNVGQRAR